MKNLKSKLFSIVASILLITVVSGGLYAFAETAPTSYVMQPGIQLTVDQSGIVTRVETLNTVATAVLGDLDLLQLTIEEAIAITVQHMEELGYTYGVDDILVTDNPIDIKKVERLYNELEKLHYENQNPKNHGNPHDVEDDEEDAEELDEDVEEQDHDDDENNINESNGRNEEARGYKMVQAAREIEGMNPGIYNMIKERMGKDPADFANQPIHEIVRELKQAR